MLSAGGIKYWTRDKYPIMTLELLTVTPISGQEREGPGTVIVFSETLLPNDQP